MITVTETSGGIHVRQDRFLNNGTADADENETLWFGIFASTREKIFILFRNVPLGILTVDEDGQVNIDKTAFLEEREKNLAIDASKNFKLNAGTVGFCEFHFPVDDGFGLISFEDRVLYTPERLSKIATEAAKEDSVFSLNDRIGLLYDVSELSKAGLSKLSAFLTLVDTWRNEANCK